MSDLTHDDASVAVRLASLEGTVRGWADLMTHRIGNVEREVKDVRVDVDKLRQAEQRRAGRLGLIIGAASLGTGFVAAFAGPMVEALFSTSAG